MARDILIQLGTEYIDSIESGRVDVIISVEGLNDVIKPKFESSRVVGDGILSHGGGTSSPSHIREVTGRVWTVEEIVDGLVEGWSRFGVEAPPGSSFYNTIVKTVNQGRNNTITIVR